MDIYVGEGCAKMACAIRSPAFFPWPLDGFEVIQYAVDVKRIPILYVNDQLTCILF